MTKWKVTGQRATGKMLEADGVLVAEWPPFDEDLSAESKAEARWQARRKFALGKAGAKIEDEPPHPDREVLEIAAPSTLEESLALEEATGVFTRPNPRTALRSNAEETEYRRLVDTVQIEAVIAVATGGAGGSK